MTFSIVLQFALVLAAIWMGARFSGIGVGLRGAVGLLVLVVGFGVNPTSPPIDVMLIILAVIMAASVMDAAGGIDFLVRIAERVIRANPKYVTIVAPLFLGGQLQAQQDIRTAEQKQAIAEHGRVGARAFGEVENALSAEFSLDAREAILKQAVTDNVRALELANVRYKVGSGDLRAVQQQLLALAAARTALLRVQGGRLVQRVNLHLALGGSFDVPATTTAAQ